MATNAKHTPGPWDFDLFGAEHDQHGINSDCCGGGPWRAIATVHTGRLGGGSKPVQAAEAAANARLIAAAPDLLSALEPVAREIRDKLPTPGEQNWNPDAHVEITLTIAECRAILAAAAIAKATGEG